jgi:hypothetical protein
MKSDTILLKHLLVCLMIGGLSITATHASDTVDPVALLKKADHLRLPPSSGEILLTLTSYRNGEQHDQTRYKILTDAADNTLTERLGGASRGQKILSKNDNLWFYSPRSRRAVRITPLQRLVGEANFGDIARLRWHLDYTPELDSTTPKETCQDEVCWKLQLTPRQPAAVYRRITLWVSMTGEYPVMAHFFVASGKHFRTVLFEPPITMDTEPETSAIKSFTFIDPWQKDRYTTLQIDQITLMDIPARVFTLTGLEMGR